MFTTNQELKRQVDAWLDERIDEFMRSVPMASHQRDGVAIDLRYYVRHVTETIRRIRLKREVDARVVLRFAKVDPPVAKEWAEYTEDEMLHDELFMADLARFDVARERVYGGEPFFSTQLLQGYFYYTLEHEGPMAPIASAYFLEYTTRKTQPAWLDNLSVRLGADKVKGARAHVAYDSSSEHTDFVWKVLTSLITTPEDERRLLTHLERIYGLFCAYFTELYQSVISERGSAPTIGAPSAPEVASAAAAALHGE